MTDADTEAGRGEGLAPEQRAVAEAKENARTWSDGRVATELEKGHALSPNRMAAEHEAARRLRQSDSGGARDEHPTMRDHCLDCGSENVQVFSRATPTDEVPDGGSTFTLSELDRLSEVHHDPDAKCASICPYCRDEAASPRVKKLERALEEIEAVEIPSPKRVMGIYSHEQGETIRDLRSRLYAVHRRARQALESEGEGDD